jgi:hypothetical protein
VRVRASATARVPIGGEVYIHYSAPQFNGAPDGAPARYTSRYPQFLGIMVTSRCAERGSSPMPEPLVCRHGV